MINIFLQRNKADTQPTHPVHPYAPQLCINDFLFYSLSTRTVRVLVQLAKEQHGQTK